jgi:hypothetical protein
MEYREKFFIGIEINLILWPIQDEFYFLKHAKSLLLFEIGIMYSYLINSQYYN